MATNYARYKAFNYIRLNGINQSLVDTLLIGLEGALPQGIRLEDPENPGVYEFLPLHDAAELVLTWFIDVKEGKTPDQNALNALIKKKSYALFSRLLKVKIEGEINDPHKLQVAALAKNLTDFRKGRTAAFSQPIGQSSSGRVLDAYLKNYNTILSQARSGIVSQKLLKELVPLGLPSDRGDLTQQMLSAFIVQNLTRLSAVSRTSTDPDVQDYAVAKEFGKLIKDQNPALLSYQNLLGDKVIAHNLRGYTDYLAQTFVADGGDLDQLEKESILSARGLENLILTQTELQQALFNNLPLIREGERAVYAREIIKTIIKNHNNNLSPEQIIQEAGTALHANADEVNAITESLKKSGFYFQIELNEQEMAVLASSHHLTRGERNLLKKGINPFLLHDSLSTLTKKEAALLKQYTGIVGKPFVTLREAYENELNSANPNSDLLNRYRSHFDQVDSYRYLTKSERASLGRTKFGRWLLEARSSYAQLDRQFWDKWTEIESIVTGEKFLDIVRDFSGKITIPGTKIPLFKLNNWLNDQIYAFKKKTTQKLILKTANSDSYVGKFFHWSLTQYKLGGHSVDGAHYHMLGSVWSSAVKWGMVRTGLSSVFKYSARYGTKVVANASYRTATRILLSIGGKALARLGGKALGALLTSATVIGSVLFAIGIAWDIIKIGWTLAKEFIQNIEFRKTVIKIGAVASVAMGAVIAIFSLRLLRLLFGPLAILIQAFFIVIISAFIISSYQHRLSQTFHLDAGSALQQVAVNILCDDNTASSEVGTETKSAGNSSVLSRASCLAKYLNECYGPSVNASNISRGLSCLALYAIAPNAIAEIQNSATNFVNLQCVGFVKAAVAWAGQSISSHNACGYVSDPKFVSGLGGVKPGDAIVFKSSGTCSNEAPGHIGILKEDAGANVCLIDANQKCAGCVVDGNCLPKTNVAGYLRL